MTDLELMQKIKTELGDYIAGAVEGTPFPASLLAAITANESDGVANAQRFEPAVFADLGRVVAGQKTSYAPAGCKRAITSDHLLAVCCPTTEQAPAKMASVYTFPQGMLALVNLATSFGPTQIMGWHALEMGFALGELCSLPTHFDRAVQLIEWFKERYNLGTPEPQSFFHCWNTGSPVAPTFDPEYVTKGMARMALYD